MDKLGAEEKGDKEETGGLIQNIWNDKINICLLSTFQELSFFVVFNFWKMDLIYIHNLTTPT